MTKKQRLEWSLFSLRLCVFVVMFAWTLDKILNPAHGARVFDSFYGLAGIGDQVMIAIGVVEMILIFAFLAGIKKRVTYGLVLVLHGVSTLSSWPQYTTDINLLFFAAWPMLAACWTLYLLRDQDRKLVIGT